MTQLRNLAINLEVGQEIRVGKHNERAKITKIEYFDKSGDISVNTTKGPRKVLTFRLCDDSDLYDCLLYTSPSPRDATLSRMPSSA